MLFSKNCFTIHDAIQVEQTEDRTGMKILATQSKLDHMRNINETNFHWWTMRSRHGWPHHFRYRKYECRVGKWSARAANRLIGRKQWAATRLLSLVACVSAYSDADDTPVPSVPKRTRRKRVASLLIC